MAESVSESLKVEYLATDDSERPENLEVLGKHRPKVVDSE